MDRYGWLCLFLAGLGLAFGLYQWYRRCRTIRRLDGMLSAAVDGSFRESSFDESVPSALEAKLARFLNGSAVSTQALERDRAAIQTLISDISHQTKTPIANILLYASLLEEGDLPPEQAGQAGILARQAEKLSFLIQALVKASRLETGILSMVPEDHGLQQLLEEALLQGRQAAQTKGITLEASPTQARARFDPRWTGEALYNIVDNALKYTPAGGRVSLWVEEFELFCAIQVEDNGPGIPEAEQAGVFGRFQRGENAREQDGLGIGLYLAREILIRQGGYIKMRSRPGEGSRFSLYLPRE